MNKVLKFIDLFAGLGGFHLALTGSAMRMNGLEFECVFASELKEDLRNQYRVNFPETNIVGDITQISPFQIPAHDILCAGFPCQPFSQAGKREGFNDSRQRGNLFDYICDIVSFHKPKYLFLENVQNLKNHDNGNTWKVIQEKLDKLGYDVISEILSPHQFGLSQHRKRIFIFAVNRQLGSISNCQFPIPKKDAYKFCDVTKLVDSSDKNCLFLKMVDSVWYVY